MGYSLEYADSGKGPHVPALSSTTIPNLLEVIDRLRLGVCPPPKEGDPLKGQQGDPPKEQQDLLESLAVKNVPKPSDPKDIYQKFLNALSEQPDVQNPDPAPEPGNLTPNLTVGDPPHSPWSGKSTPAPRSGRPLANPGVPAGSDWEPGKTPMSKEEPKKLFSYRNPLYNKPSVPPSKISDTILPIPCKGQAAGGEGSQGGDLSGSGVSPSWADNPPLDHSQGDPFMEKMPEQETPSQEVAKPIKNVLHPSRLPRKDLKYTDGKHTILDPTGCPIGSLRLTDVVKSEKSSASGAAKRKEPDTPDLGSGGASAPIWKRVKFEGVTFFHRSTPSIHVGLLSTMWKRRMRTMMVRKEKVMRMMTTLWRILLKIMPRRVKTRTKKSKS